MGHAAIAFVDVVVGFADRAAVVVAVGFLGIYGFYIRKEHRTTEEEMEDQLDLEDQGTGNTPNPSGT